MNFQGFLFQSWKTEILPNLLCKLKKFLIFLPLHSFIKISRIFKITGILILSYLIYKQLPFNNKSRLIYADNKMNNFIKHKLGKISYRPTFYMPGCLSQIIYHQLNPRPDLNFKREYIQTEDGGVFSIDWVAGPLKDTKKLLVVLHGLLGGSESGYLREILTGFLVTGEYKIVVVHNRGISETPLFTPFCFHASFTSDLQLALNLIKKRLPNYFCCCLGTSLGANIFVKFLAQDNSFNEYIKCLISISNPLNIFEGEKRNRGGLVCKFMKNKFAKYYNMHQILKRVDGIDYRKLNEIKDYHEIDSLFTLKIHKNFKSLEDYYIKSSSCYDIHKLRVPTLFINSKDDIFSPYDTIDYSDFYSNEKLMMILTDTGGHVTYFHENLRPKRWFIQKSILYSQAIYDFYQEHKQKQ